MSQGNTSQLVQLHLSNQIKIQHNIGFLENANHQKTKKKTKCGQQNRLLTINTLKKTQKNLKSPSFDRSLGRKEAEEAETWKQTQF